MPVFQSSSPLIRALFGFTRNELRVVAILALISLLLGGAAILRPLLWPTAQAPPLPVLNGSDDGDEGLLTSNGIVDPEDAPVPVTAFVIDLNTAPVDSLELLPGVGRVLADRIIEYRTKRPFTSPLELLKVYGIGPTTYERMRPFVRINLVTAEQAQPEITR